jgi:hypothetical protein
VNRFHNTIIPFVLVFLIICFAPLVSAAEAIVDIQINDGQDYISVKAMTDELVKRGIKGTLWISQTELSKDWESLISDLNKRGFEIGVRPDVDISKLGYLEQYSLTSSIAKVINECTGKPVKAFRTASFLWNEDTAKLADDMNFAYIMADVGIYPERFGDVPYQPYLHYYKALGVTRTDYPNGKQGILCDVASSQKMTSGEYREVQFREIDERIHMGKPLVISWHPTSVTRPVADNPWWRVFLESLDYLKSKDGELWFATGEDIVLFYNSCAC